MKKKLMFVAAIATMGLGAFLTSCGKDSTCVCDFVADGMTVTETVDLTEEGYETVGSCDELTTLLEYADYGYFDRISCK